MHTCPVTTVATVTRCKKPIRTPPHPHQACCCVLCLSLTLVWFLPFNQADSLAAAAAAAATAVFTNATIWVHIRNVSRRSGLLNPSGFFFCQQRPGGLTPPLSRTWSQGRNVWSAGSTNRAGYIRRNHTNKAVTCQTRCSRGKKERKMNKYRQQEVTGRRTYLDSQVYRLIIRFAPQGAPASHSSRPIRARL